MAEEGIEFMKYLYEVCTLLVIMLIPIPALSIEILVDDFKTGLSAKWESKSFKGSTLYEKAEEDGRLCIKATSSSSASGLYYRIKYDAKEYPTLSWSWKVDNIISKGNALKKQGDDYSARIYVVFTSILFWNTKVINYIWANKLPVNQAVPNPYTENAMMVAVESGPAKAGQWIEERRNVFEDFRKYFGYAPPEVGAIAIMTDTDNTGEEAVAWYGPIRILGVSGQ